MLRPIAPYVICPSWIRRPASAWPSATTRGIWSNATTITGGSPSARRSKRYAVVPYPGMAMTRSGSASGGMGSRDTTIGP